MAKKIFFPWERTPLACLCSLKRSTLEACARRGAPLLVAIGCIILISFLWLKITLSGVRAGDSEPASGPQLAAFDSNALPLFLKITFGLHDSEPTDWNGTAHLDKGEFTEIQGWVFDASEQVNGPTVSWQVKTKIANFDTSRERGGGTGEGQGPRRERYGSSPTRPVGVWLELRSPAGATLSVNTVKGSFQVPLTRIAGGSPVLALDGRV